MAPCGAKGVAPGAEGWPLRKGTPLKFWAPTPKMVWGHNLQHMAPFGALTGGFCMVFQPTTLIFLTLDPIFGAPTLDLGPGRPRHRRGPQKGSRTFWDPDPDLGIQKWSLGVKIPKLGNETPCRIHRSMPQTEPYVASYGPKPFWGGGPKFWGATPSYWATSLPLGQVMKASFKVALGWHGAPFGNPSSEKMLQNL